jgi:hypothetical protein
MRARLAGGVLLLPLLLVGWSGAAEAQRVTPVAVRRADVSGRHQSRDRSIAALPAAGSSRAGHAAWGALAGAVVGGVLGFLIDQSDHTGEGLSAPVMVGGGALLGAGIGALAGALVPSR